MKTITILKIKKFPGWYSFEDVPQEGKYIKIGALNCGTDRKAINRAKRINPDYSYVIGEEIPCQK